MIGVFCDSYYPYMDGVVNCVRNNVYWLNRNYTDAMLFVPGKPKYERQEDFPKREFLSVKIPGCKGFRLGVPYLDYEYRKVVDTMDFELVHAHSPFMSADEAIRLRRIKDIPAVMTFHSKFKDDILEYTKSKGLSELGVKNIVAMFNRMDAVFSVSNGTADTLRSYGYKKDIRIIENGCDLKKPTEQDGADARAKFGLAKDMPVFLFVGQIIIQKNIPAIIEAAALVKRDYRLLLVGGGLAQAKIEKMIEELGLAGKVMLVGRIEDRRVLGGLYKAANAFVFPSIYDNAPLVVREAAVASCPSILAAGSNAAEGFEDKKTAFICEPTPDRIAECMDFVIDNPERAREIGRAASGCVRTWEEVTSEIYHEYQKVIAEYKNQPHTRSRFLT